jgi:hypothetical protein
MRLLSTNNLQFCDFFDQDIPQYAILSHRWECDELSYQDMVKEMEHNDMWPEPRSGLQKQGFRKINEFRCLALRDGYEYVWIDTCCIDKSSSAELQEAINSMYQWYWNCGVCYAYLSDVSIPDDWIDQHGKLLPESSYLESFKRSQWFARGWTLQELLAPQDLIFVDQSWKKFGTANDLQKSIKEATGINVQIDMHQDHTRSETLRVARCMSWAANRLTTRIEDRSYSLLGLFDVSLPMMYGEGGRAFQRLQREILKVDEDASILAWSCIDADTGFAPNGLAPSPDHFSEYRKLVSAMRETDQFVTLNAMLTQRGLQVALRIQRDPNDSALGYAVLIHQKGPSSGDSESLVIPLIFPRATSRADPSEDCVRFSDPLWVPSSFVNTAVLESVCFIRRAQAADMSNSSVGFSLCPTVWRNYITTFTYPVQTKAKSRHFPAVFGGFSRSTGRKPRCHTFILELTSRHQASERFVVLVNYQLEGWRMLETPTVTVIKMGKAIDLANAVHLAKSGKAQDTYPSCDLPDCSGNAISTGEIVKVHSFYSYWLLAGDNDLDELPFRSILRPAFKALNSATIRMRSSAGR